MPRVQLPKGSNEVFMVCADHSNTHIHLGDEIKQGLEAFTDPQQVFYHGRALSVYVIDKGLYKQLSEHKGDGAENIKLYHGRRDGSSILDIRQTNTKNAKTRKRNDAFRRSIQLGTDNLKFKPKKVPRGAI